MIPVICQTYETVAAGQSAQVLGTVGQPGDYLGWLVVVPATTDAGAITVTDDATTFTVFTGGTGSLSNLVPFPIPLGLRSKTGPWKVTTGAAVSVVAVGNWK
jgi:hypothetical protein